MRKVQKEEKKRDLMSSNDPRHYEGTGRYERGNARDGLSARRLDYVTSYYAKNAGMLVASAPCFRLCERRRRKIFPE